jgi:hypothetical protein
MDEGRKKVIGVMAAILAARKLAQYDGKTASPCHDQRDCRRDPMG